MYVSALSNDTPLVVAGYQAAELMKVAASAFLATNISFMNAIAEIPEVGRSLRVRSPRSRRGSQ